MKRLKPKKTNTVKVFRLDFIAFSVVILMLFLISFISKPAIFGDIELELPRGIAKLVIVEDDPIVISINREEEIFVEDDNIKLNYLPKRILELSNDNLEVKIFVKADKELNFNKIVEVVSTINSQGFGNVSLMIDISKDI